MDPDESLDPTLFGTWKPAPFDPGNVSDEEEENEEVGTFSFLAPVYTGYRPRTNYQGQRFNPNARFNTSTFGKPFQNRSFAPAENERDKYWTTTGPKTEPRKMLGNTLELPIVAPMSAPPEDKKIILTQTKDKIAEAASGDWQSKTQQLSQRFTIWVPNAINDAKVRLAKFKDFTSNVFLYGPANGLGADMNPANLMDLDLRYLAFEIRVHPRQAPRP